MRRSVTARQQERQAREKSYHDPSETAPPLDIRVESEPRKAVLYDHQGRALVREIGFARAIRRTTREGR